MRKIDFKGVWTAIVTPMNNDGQVDYDSLEKMVEMQVLAKVDGIVSVGTTGESPTLSKKEHIDVIKETAKFVKGRISLLAGTGSNCTFEAVKYTKEADIDGVDGFLSVAPYYNKPSQEGVFRHFAEIAKVTDKPILLYTIPGRCGIGIENDTVLRLRDSFENYCAIKEAGGKVEKVADLHKRAGNSISILSGDDGLTLEFMNAGARGVVSVASNIIPAEMVEFVNDIQNGNIQKAKEFNAKYAKFFKDLFIEPNPVPAKTALKYANIIANDYVRLPLCEMRDANKAKLIDTCKEIGL